MSMRDCEHIIGMVYDYDDTRLVTLCELEKHIAHGKPLYNSFWLSGKPYELSDYADKRKTTDLSRFNFCPKCGEPIDWKAIKEIKQ